MNHAEIINAYKYTDNIPLVARNGDIQSIESQNVKHASTNVIKNVLATNDDVANIGQKVNEIPQQSVPPKTVQCINNIQSEMILKKSEAPKKVTDFRNVIKNEQMIKRSKRKIKMRPEVEAFLKRRRSMDVRSSAGNLSRTIWIQNF